MLPKIENFWRKSRESLVMGDEETLNRSFSERREIQREKQVLQNAVNNLGRMKLSCWQQTWANFYKLQKYHVSSSISQEEEEEEDE